MENEKHSNVKVYEQKPRGGLPFWLWLLPLLALLGFGLWWFTRRADPAAAPEVRTDNVKPEHGPATPASGSAAASGTWTTATIADSFRRGGRFSLTDAEVHFATGSAKLEGDSQAVLDQVAQVFKDNSDWRLRVVGHTDTKGSAAANELLASERAKAVATYLASHGVDRSRVRPVEEKGERQPKAENATEMGRAENRRVELIKE